MKTSETAAACGLLAFIWLFIYGTFVLLISFWTERNMDFWVSHFKGHVVHVPFILDILISIFGPFVVIGNIVAEIARYFI